MCEGHKYPDFSSGVVRRGGLVIMFWFGKKKNKNIQDEEAAKNSNVPEEKPESENIEEDLEEDIDLDSAYLIDCEDDADCGEAADEEDEAEREENEAQARCVTVDIGSLDDLAEFVNNRAVGALQFMNKETLDAFEIRESHIRMAEVWGSISMARECSPDEYARIMLAAKLIEDPESFYVLPGLTENEVKQAIKNFCSERYGSNGKKYASDFSKFSAFLKEQDDLTEWKAFTKEAVYDKLTEFCKSNNIDFSDRGTGSDE